MNTKISGKTYAEKKEYARNLAIEYSYNDSAISWGELTRVQGFFEKIGRRYGLLREFRENAIC